MTAAAVAAGAGVIAGVATGEGVGSCPKALKARAQARDEIQVLSVVFMIILWQ